MQPKALQLLSSVPLLSAVHYSRGLIGALDHRQTLPLLHWVRGSLKMEPKWVCSGLPGEVLPLLSRGLQLQLPLHCPGAAQGAALSPPNQHIPMHPVLWAGGSGGSSCSPPCTASGLFRVQHCPPRTSTFPCTPFFGLAGRGAAEHPLETPMSRGHVSGSKPTQGAAAGDGARDHDCGPLPSPRCP